MNEDRDEMQALEPQAGETLERKLGRYARVRLDPTPAQARRARAAVMEAAWRRRLEPAAGAAAQAGAPDGAVAGAPRVAADGAGSARRRLFAGWGPRRLTGALAAAALAGLLVGATSFAASRAGGPLYESRLALEDLALPSDPAARVEAEIAHAQARLAEIVEAASHGDSGAMTAALHAYDQAVDQLGTTTGGPAGRALEAVASHQAVLERVAAAAPAAAQAGLAEALGRSDAAIERLTTAGAGAPGAPGAPGTDPANGAAGGDGRGPGASPGPGGGNAGGNGRGPAASPKPGPVMTAKPDHTPAPKPSRSGDGGRQRQTDAPSPKP